MPKKTFHLDSHKPGSETTNLRVGDAARCLKGLYAGRTGRVQSINVDAVQNRPEYSYVEVGVKFTLGSRVSWFRNDELVKVIPAPTWIAELANDPYEPFE